LLREEFTPSRPRAGEDEARSRVPRAMRRDAKRAGCMHYRPGTFAMCGSPGSAVRHFGTFVLHPVRDTEACALHRFTFRTTHLRGRSGGQASAPPPVFLCRPRAGPHRTSNPSFPRGERSAGRRGGVRNPRWMVGETTRWDALRRRPLPPCDRRKAPPGAPHAAFCDKVRAALPRTWTSHACQPAPGGRSYCLRAEPRHRPGVKGYVRLHPRRRISRRPGFPVAPAR
jgi:hypothetical protein